MGSLLRNGTQSYGVAIVEWRNGLANVEWRIGVAYMESGPLTGGDTWEFFPGPTAPGEPMGAHSKGNFLFNFKETKKLKAFGPGR